MAEVAMIVVVAAVISWALTGLVRRYALHQALLDMPNHRSSHSDPTPRGGGLSITLTVLVGIAGIVMASGLSARVGAALSGGGLVALVGWIDDHRDVPARWRAITQIVAATWAVYWLGVSDALWIGPWSLSLGAATPLIAVLGVVWLTNLFNFMDGIDGIAAGEALCVAGIGGAFMLLAGYRGLALIGFLVAAASLGFLVWNWAPARIFMGDVGSGFLGFILGVIALESSRAGAVPLLVWILLLGVFLFDATVTLLRRVAAGERFFVAHRQHAYQRAVQAGSTHRRVTSAVLLLNLVLAILAAVVWLMPLLSPFGIVAALVILSAMYTGVERVRPMWGGGPAAAAIQER